MNKQTVSGLILKIQILLMVRSSTSCVMLWYFQCKQNLLTNNMWTYTIRNLLENQWEILVKKFTLDVDSGYKDVAHIQNDLLYVSHFTDFTRLKIKLQLTASGCYSKNGKVFIDSNNKLFSPELKILKYDGLWEDNKNLV